jgi:hypothetical protein
MKLKAYKVSFGEFCPPKPLAWLVQLQVSQNQRRRLTS